MDLTIDRAWLSALRREFHQCPELGLQEFRTARRIEEELDRLDIPHRRVGETGVLGILRGEPNGGAVALRADIDALPIQETNPAEYRSRQDGVMHACGHDGHTACLLGAAKLLAARRETLPGEVRFIFQPAEEIGRGAEDFVAGGALDGVGRVFGLHVAPDLAVGTVGVKPGLNYAAVDLFRIVVEGKAAHVSTPHLGVDALYIGSQLVTALQGLATRRTSPVEPVVIGVGKFHAGTTYNAVAGEAVLEGTTRTVSQESRERLRVQIDTTARNMAEMYGGTARVEWTGITPALFNDAQACTEAAQVVRELCGPDKVVSDRALSLGGDNFAEFLRKVPGVYVYLGTGNPELPLTLNSIHNGNFDLDEEALVIGARLYAGYALAVLESGAAKG